MKALLLDEIERLAPDVDAFPWEERAAYADWLSQTYYYVRHSTRLLATAAGRFDLDERGTALHRRFAEHLREESNHEVLAVRDAKEIGESIADYPELPATRMFYESQYYKIEHLQAVAFFGYILALEAVGPRFGQTLSTRIQRTFGNRCTSFLRVHTEPDAEHLDKALKMVEALTERERALVEDNVHQTLYGYGAILAQIRTRRARR
jgi:pyrroloquinoline quinone (PQQ) biosynthesis protein C